MLGSKNKTKFIGTKFIDSLKKYLATDLFEERRKIWRTNIYN